MMGHGSGMGGWGWWLVGALLLLGFVIVGGLAVRGRRALAGRAAHPELPTGSQLAARSEARELLDNRYARGELDTEEYRERLVTLEQQA